MLPDKWTDVRERFGDPRFPHIDHYAPCKARIHIEGEGNRELTENIWSAAKRVEDCDRCGVTLQVLSTLPAMFSYWAKPEHAHALSQILNDHLAGVVASHPSRFTALGTLPMQSTELAILELERCVKQLRMPGVQIGTNVAGRNLDDPGVVAVLEAAQEFGAAVFVHPWDMVGAERMKNHWLAWLVGMPAETALAIGSVVLGGVLERLQRLRIGFAHGGGSFVHGVGRIEAGYRVRPDLCATAAKAGPREHLGRFYVDSLTHDPDALRNLIRLLGPERIALGSDYPFPLGEHHPGSMIESMNDLSPTVKQRLLYATACEFLQRTPEQ